MKDPSRAAEKKLGDWKTGFVARDLVLLLRVWYSRGIARLACIYMYGVSDGFLADLATVDGVCAIREYTPIARHLA
jgi:hypothetical protein